MYTISSSCHLYEVTLNATCFTLLGMKNFPERGLLRPEFLNLGKTLYVVSCIARDVYEAYEMDFEQMACKWIEKPIVENAFFVGDWKSSVAVNPDTWAKRQMRNERLGLKDSDKRTAKTMHMNRYQNGNASSSKSLKTSIISSLSSWSNLDHDLLLPILMKLGPVDFLAFSGVCKSWRSLAFANLNKFMGSRRPISVSFSTSTNNECYLEDFEGRKFKTILPHSTGSTCVGLTCGYLIFFRSITCEFWLVNPLSKCELHFPNFPRSYKVDTNPSIFRVILVFSPSRSQWVLVISQKFTKRVLYSVSGNQATWRVLSLPFPILDIHSFNGKMYTISSSCHIYEVRLNAMPSLTLLGMKNFPERGLLRPEFVNSGKTLYVVSCIARDVYEAYEMDFEQMECMRIEKPTVENAFFVGDWKSSAAVNPDTWAKRQMRNERLGLKDSDQSKIKGRCLIANMWYFPHECFNANLLQ